MTNNDILIGEFNLYDIIKNYSYLIENLPDSKKYQIEHENFSISEIITELLTYTNNLKYQNLSYK